MCWVSHNTLNKQIASENIKVYKIVNFYSGDLISYFKGFTYEINKLYETEVNPIKDIDCNMISKGFYSYSKNNKLTFSGGLLYVCANLLETSEIYSKYSDNDGLVVVECVIPKNSEYYVNESGEIVSNQIILSNKYIDVNNITVYKETFEDLFSRIFNLKISF